MFILDRGQNHVHEHLERGRGIAHSKVHYFWLERAEARFECCFPLVSVLDSDIIIPPSHVEFGEDPCVSNLLYQIWDKG